MPSSIVFPIALDPLLATDALHLTFEPVLDNALLFDSRLIMRLLAASTVTNAIFSALDGYSAHCLPYFALWPSTAPASLHEADLVVLQPVVEAPSPPSSKSLSLP